MTSQMEQRVRVIAARVYGDSPHEYGYRPDWLTGSKGVAYELDIYYPDLKVAIEVNGEQHYKTSKLQSKRQLGKQQERDTFKADRCAEQGIELVVIKDMRSEEAIESRLLQAAQTARDGV